MLPGVRDIANTLAARGIAMAGPILVAVITARVLGPEDRGQYFLVVSYAQIAAQIANLGLHSSNTYLCARRPEILGPLVVNSLYVATFVAPLVAAVLILLLGQNGLFGQTGASSPGSHGAAGFIAVLLAPLLLAFLYLTNLAVAVKRLGLFNGLTIFAGLMAVVAAAAAALLGFGTVGFLFAAVAAIAASCAAGTFLLVKGKPLHPVFHASLFREGVAYAFRAYLGAIFSFLMMRVGVIVLQYRSDLAEIGQFSIAMQVADAVILLPSTVALLLFPGLVRADHADRWLGMWRVFWRLGLTMAGLLLLLALLLPWLIPLAFGGAYLKAVPLTQFILVPAFELSLMTVVSQFLAAEGFPWRLTIAWGIGFLVQAATSFWLAPIFNGFGIVIALSVSCTIVFAIIGVETRVVRLKSLHDTKK